MPPDQNELGWKETVRMNPLESCIVALRPVAPTLPFEVPNSIRLIDPTMPEGTVLSGGPWGFTDPIAEPVTVINHEVNFGWEYVYHCHLLGHEEMDMMHAVPFAVAPRAPSILNLTLLNGPRRIQLSWHDNSISETGFIIQRADDVNFTTGLVTFTVGADVTIYTDTTIVNNKAYYYRVQANNVVGDTAIYPAPSIGFPSVSMASAFSNTVTFGPPTITTSSNLPPGEVGVPYSQTLTAINGIKPYTWSISVGALPPGLTLITFQVTDSVGGIATKQIRIRIDPGPTITTLNLPPARLNRPYSTTLSANGGTTPYTWSISVGTLPPGLTLNPTTGVISGTPTITVLSHFTVRVTDILGSTATRALSIQVNP